MLYLCVCLQQAEVPDDSDNEDPDEVFGFISIINLTDRKVEYQHVKYIRNTSSFSVKPISYY